MELALTQHTAGQCPPPCLHWTQTVAIFPLEDFRHRMMTFPNSVSPSV